MNDKDNCYLVFGATGYSGEEVVRTFINNGKKTRICVRDRGKADKVFSDFKEKLDKVYVLNDFSSEEEIKNIICDVANENNKVVVISLIAYNYEKDKVDDNEMYRDQFLTNSLIIKAASQEKKVVKYVFISTLFLQRPGYIRAKFIESRRPGALFLKSLLEYQIKTSGMNYLILRPGKLVFSKINEDPAEILVSQGDKIGGFISYNTLAFVLNNLISSDQYFNKNMTIDLAGPGNMISTPLNKTNFYNNLKKLEEDKFSKQDLVLKNFEGHCKNEQFKIPAFDILLLGLSLRVISYYLTRRYIKNSY